MGTIGGPNVVKDCLTLYLDTPNERSYKGEPTVNVVPYPNFSPGRYNNTGFGGTITCTGQGTFKGSPVYLTTFTPTTTAQVSRLCSTDGFGFLHSMGCRLFPNTTYLSSVYFCTNYPLVSGTTCGFANDYSNISGWANCSTNTTRIEECGWTRLYTRYFRNTNGFIDRQTTLRIGCTINTNSAQAITFCAQIALGSLTDSGGVCAVVSHSPNVSFTDTLTGVTIANHGLNTTDWCKATWPANPIFRTSLPYWYYVQLNVPSTGGVNRTMCIEYRPNAYYCSVADSKYWKVTFNPVAGGAVCGSVICAWWAAPMLEQKSTVYPSNFVIGTRGGTAATGGGWLDISGNSNNGEFINGPSFLPGNNGAVLFDGVDDKVYVNNSSNLNFIGNQPYSAFAWIYPNLGGVTWHGIISKGNSQQYALTLNSGGAYLHYETNQGGVGALNSANNSITANTWQFVGIRFDGANKTIWKNGQIIATQAASTLNSASNTEQLRIGEGNNGEVFRGSIAGVGVYARALSDMEIMQTYNSTKTRFGL